MGASLCSVSPTNAPFDNTHNPSWGNHTNSSWEPRPSQYAHPPHAQYASLSQPQPPQQISPVEQAILDLTKKVGDVVEEHKKFNAQLSQRIHIVENSLDQKLDGLQSELIIKLTTYRHQFQGLPSNMFIKRRRIWRKSVFWVNRLKCNLRGNQVQWLRWLGLGSGSSCG